MPSAISPDHVYHLITVSDPSMSHDGARLAFVRSKIDEEQMERHSQVMMMSLPDGQPYPFTQGREDEAPRFSPDGSSITFVRPDDKGRKQLWLIPVHAGEARRLTDVPGGVSDHAWSPNSRHLAFASDVDPDRLPDDHDAKKDPHVRVVRRIRYRSDITGWRGDAFHHLFVVDAQTGETRQLTQGEGDDRLPTWSPDGRSIAFVSDRLVDRDITWYSEAYVVPFEGGEAQQWSQGLYSVGAAAWSPDGSKLAVLGTDDVEIGDPWQAWLFAIGPGQAPHRLTDGSYTPVLPAPQLRWTDDGRIVFLADHRGESSLCEMPAEGGALRTITGGGVQYTAVALDGTASRAAVVAVTPSSPGDLDLVDIKDGSQTRLTAFNDDYLVQHPPATMEKFSISRAGMEIESRLWLPPDFDPSRQYPLVVDIHGGPHGKFADAFNSTQQVLATAGYVVLAVNPRGTASYGPEFAKAVLRDWGGQDYLDIIAAVDEVCLRPYVDTSRIGVHGYSYGGYMSAWIVGHDTRFGAAVVGAPCISLLSAYGTSDIGVSFGETQWGRTPEDARDILIERSPLTYAPYVQTPVLLLHGEEDYRCPLGQSEEYFVALKRLGKEVELVRFPGASHSFLRSGHPRLREEYLGRMLAWFDRLLPSDTRPAIEAQPAEAPV